MPFKVNKINTASFPSKEVVQRALGFFGTSIENIETLVRAFGCPEPLVEGEGYQQAIAASLAKYFTEKLVTSGCIPTENRYSTELNERADVALTKLGIPTSFLIEIEFRPNVEKDLVKFQIGSNSGLLGVGMLVLTLDRDSINPAYTTMPEFEKYRKIVQLLRPNYPLLLVGFSGNHFEKKEEESQSLNIQESDDEIREGTITGALLNEMWAVGAEHALYHQEGKWYHVLTTFPGALFDPYGYILFQSENEFKTCDHLSIGVHVNVRQGICNIPGYRKVR